MPDPLPLFGDVLESEPTRDGRPFTWRRTWVPDAGQGE